MTRTLDPEILGQVVAGEYGRSVPGSAETFVKLVRLMVGLGLTERQAFTVAKNVFQREHATYLSAVDSGEISPLAFGPYAGRFALRFDDDATGKPELN